MKARDAVAVSALRSALGAIENAAAVDAVAPGGGSEIAGSVFGLMATEVDRRTLSDSEMADVIRTEMAERLDAARDFELRGNAPRAARLHAEADVLSRYLERGAS